MSPINLIKISHLLAKLANVELSLAAQNLSLDFDENLNERDIIVAYLDKHAQLINIEKDLTKFIINIWKNLNIQNIPTNVHEFYRLFMHSAKTGFSNLKVKMEPEIIQKLNFAYARWILIKNQMELIELSKESLLKSISSPISKDVNIKPPASEQNIPTWKV